MRSIGAVGKLVLGVCLTAAAIFTGQSGSMFDAAVCGCMAVPFFGGAVGDLVRWKRRTGEILRRDNVSKT